MTFGRGIFTFALLCFGLGAILARVILGNLFGSPLPATQVASRSNQSPVPHATSTPRPAATRVPTATPTVTVTPNPTATATVPPATIAPTPTPAPTLAPRPTATPTTAARVAAVTHPGTGRHSAARHHAAISRHSAATKHHAATSRHSATTKHSIAAKHSTAARHSATTRRTIARRHVATTRSTPRPTVTPRPTPTATALTGVVTLTNYWVGSRVARDGETIEIGYVIDNGTGRTQRITLGASLKSHRVYSWLSGQINDPVHDVVAIVPPGISDHARYFTLPLSLRPGIYDVAWGLRSAVSGKPLALVAAPAALHVYK